MVHNIVKGALAISILLAIGHYIYAHYIMGNSPMELIVGIILLTVGTALIFKARQDAITKIVLVLSAVALVYHYIYAHLLLGNSPPELVLTLIILIPTVLLVLMKEINFKK